MTLQTSWRECDALLLSLGRREIRSPKDESRSRNCLSFLSEICFWSEEKGDLTSQGEFYFRAKHVLQDQEEAKKILCDTLMAYAPVQYVCQNFWGRQAATRGQVENLLRHFQVLSKGETASSFLALLNHAGIITYSKRSGGKIRVRISPYPEQSTEVPVVLHRVISPDTPYSNIKNVRQVIRSCEGFIWWLDKHFDKKGLEPLAEECDGNVISEIRILSGNAQVTESARRDYESLQREMQTKSIASEWRVILDAGILGQLHDRFIISRNVIYNVPPVNSIFRGQLAEISVASPSLVPRFEQFWSQGKEMIKAWEEIQMAKKP
jgi:hypothetical protein